MSTKLLYASHYFESQVDFLTVSDAPSAAAFLAEHESDDGSRHRDARHHRARHERRRHVARVCERLDAEGHHSYFVDAGGDVRTRGDNGAGEPWRARYESSSSRASSHHEQAGCSASSV